MLKKVSVIDIERDLIDLSQEILFFLVVKYLYVPRNQTSERIQGDLADVDVETVPSELFFQERPPMAPQPLGVSIPTKPDESRTHHHQKQPAGNAKETLKHRWGDHRSKMPFGKGACRKGKGEW